VKSMPRTPDEQFLHDWVIRQLKQKFESLYTEVHINPGDEENFELNGHFPDVVLVNYGQVVQIAEVETRETLNPEEVDEWKRLSELGVKLSLVVPKELQNEARDLCWKEGLAAKVNIGSFDVNLQI